MMVLISASTTPHRRTLKQSSVSFAQCFMPAICTKFWHNHVTGLNSLQLQHYPEKDTQ